MPIQSTNKKVEKDPSKDLGYQIQLLLQSKVNAKDRRFMTEQLSLLLETGTSLHAALHTIRDQAQTPALREMLNQIIDEVSEGKPFSRALAEFPDVFDSTYVNLVGASETGGFMHQVLTQLLEMEEKREEMKATLLSAFSYPAFLIFFSVGVVVFVLVSVFPRFEELFVSIHDQLPGSTVVLLAASQVLRSYGYVLAAGLVGLLLLLKAWMASPAGKMVADRIVLKVPLVRDIIIRLYLVNSLRALSLSMSSGVSVVDALNSCRDIVRNAVFRKFFSEVQESVEQGAGLAKAFEDSPIIPDLTKKMIRTGEESGHLPHVMGRVAEYYERELNKQLLLLSKLIEPVMLLVMGVVVGYIVAALILPVFKLSGAVG